MKKQAQAAWRFIRRWWWALALGAGVVGVALWRVFGPRAPDAQPVTVSPKLIERAREQVERVHLEGEVEKARIRTQAEDTNKQLDVIEAKGKTDPKAAREALAAFLASNL
jgi:hypothetical protein